MARFLVQVKETRNGIRSTFNFTRQPIKPRSVENALAEAVKDQHNHLAESGLVVRGLDLRPGPVLMWIAGDGFKRGVSISVVPASRGA